MEYGVWGMGYGVWGLGVLLRGELCWRLVFDGVLALSSLLVVSSPETETRNSFETTVVRAVRPRVGLRG